MFFYEKCNVDCVVKMPSNITVYDTEIKIKYSHLNQGSLTQCYLANKDSLVESILKEILEIVLYPRDTYFAFRMMFLVQRNTQNGRYFMLTCENEQFHLLGPFSLNTLVKRVSEICRQDECISVMEKHICLILYFARQHCQMKRERTL